MNDHPIMPIKAEVSLEEAAALLNVSQSFAAKLFDEGAFPSRSEERRRLALASDVLAYKEKQKQARLETLDELAAHDQSLNMQ